MSYLVSRGLHVANELGIADLLKDGPRSIESLAHVTRAHQQALYRLLRMLAGNGIFAEESPGVFQLTRTAALLQRDIPGSLHNAVKMIGDMAGDRSWWYAVGRLRETVVTGEPGFNLVHKMDFFDFLTQHPEAGSWFDRGMANLSTLENASIVASYDFSALHHVIDLGGGQGGFLAEVLKVNPHLKGTLFDRPDVIKEPVFLIAAGVADRCLQVSGDLFKSVPAGGDAYILKRIFHDWNDSLCVQILRNCRAVMRPGTKILIVDAVVPTGNEPHPSKVMDILMMVLTEGRERIEDEFRELFRQAGLKLTRVIPTPSVLSIVEGELD